MKETLLCCRITAQEKGLYRLCHDGVEQAAQVSGKFQYEALGPSDYPTVGDEVLADLNGGGQAVIHKVLPRKSLFLRKAAGTAREEQPVAANVDILFLCMALNNDFNLRRLERYLAAAWNSGATPVVVLTKADLCGNPSEKVAAVEEAAPGTDVLLTSAAQEDGIRPLLPYLTPGRTVAFVGSSGVGKSTLMNGLLGKEILATGGLRNDDRGRHTTTRRQMFFLPGGAALIDTPGMRELGLWDSESGLETAFADIEALARQCRFQDCRHEKEPGCAVRAALASGELSEERFRSWQRLSAENRYADDRTAHMSAKEKKFRMIAQFNKSNSKR